MRVHAHFSIFKRFGLSSLVSDFLISLFAFFIGMFATISASNPSYAIQYRGVADKYGDSEFVIDYWVSVSRPNAEDFTKRFFFLDDGVEDDLKGLGIQFEKFYYVSNPTEVFNGIRGFYAMPKSMSDVLPVSIKHGSNVDQSSKGAQFVCGLSANDEYQLGDTFSVCLSDFEGKALFGFDAKMVASTGETSFLLGDSYNVCYFDADEFAALEQGIFDNANHFFGETDVDRDGTSVRTFKNPYAKPYILAHMNEENRSAFLEKRDAKKAAIELEWTDSTITSSMASFNEIYDLWSVQNGSGFNNVGHYPYLLASAIGSLLIVVVGQSWLNAGKHRKDSAVALIVGATKTQIICAHFAKKAIDVAFVFALGWLATYFLDYHAKALCWPKEFYANTNLYWVFCLIVVAVSLISLLLKAWELRGLDFAEAIRRDN